MITLAEFAELKTGIKELERLRKQYQNLKAQSIVGASYASYGRAHSGYADRVYTRVAALDEAEHELNNRKRELSALIDIIFNPVYDCMNFAMLPDSIRVAAILRERCEGKSWGKIGQTWGIKGSSCRHIIRRYEQQLKKLSEAGCDT